MGGTDPQTDTFFRSERLGVWEEMAKEKRPVLFARDQELNHSYVGRRRTCWLRVETRVSETFYFMHPL